MSGGIMNAIRNPTAFNTAFNSRSMSFDVDDIGQATGALGGLLSLRETSDADDWVPGDMGKIEVRNPIIPGMFGSETLIYVGSNQWRGHLGPKDTLGTLNGWLEHCATWSHDRTNYTATTMPTFGADVGEDRFFPNVGLE
jgi:hypothetical protein